MPSGDTCDTGTAALRPRKPVARELAIDEHLLPVDLHMPAAAEVYHHVPVQAGLVCVAALTGVAFYSGVFSRTPAQAAGNRGPGGGPGGGGFPGGGFPGGAGAGFRPPMTVELTSPVRDRVASKVTTQALLIASQIAGVPVQTQPQAGTSGAALATSSRALVGAEKARAQQNLLLLSHKDALRSLAGTILREWPSLDNDDDAKRMAAISASRAGFTANKSRLNLTAPAAPATSDDEDDDGAEDENEDGNL